MTASVTGPRPGILIARLAALGFVAAAVWSCSPAGPQRSTSPSTASPLPSSSPDAGSTILGATGTPNVSPSPSASASTIATPRVPFTAPKPGFIPGPGQSAQPLPSSPAVPPAKPKPMTVTIVAAGDIACDPATNTNQPKDCDQAATADQIGQLAPTAVLTLGDNQYEDGTLAAFQSVFDPTWGKYRSIMYPAIGNHEYLTKGAAGYFTYFGFPAYYSFNLGDWHLVSLDSECSAGGVGGCGPGSAPGEVASGRSGGPSVDVHARLLARAALVVRGAR